MTQTKQHRVARGTRVRLTNPNYPDLEFVGTLVEGAAATLDGYHYTGRYSTWTVRDDEGTLHRSEGIIALAPRHLEPSACFVCGSGPHDPTPLHSYWSNADATREATEHDARTTAPDAAARYVAEYRPY